MTTGIVSPAHVRFMVHLADYNIFQDDWNQLPANRAQLCAMLESTAPPPASHNADADAPFWALRAAGSAHATSNRRDTILNALTGGDTGIFSRAYRGACGVAALTDGTTALPAPALLDVLYLEHAATAVRSALQPVLVPASAAGGLGGQVVANFFLEIARGPAAGARGAAAVTAVIAERQVLLAGAHGAAMMHALQSFRGEASYDERAFAFSAAYCHGRLTLFAHHAAAPAPVPTRPSRVRPRYYMCPLRTYAMTSSAAQCRRGLAALQRLRAHARDVRLHFIRVANCRADPALYGPMPPTPGWATAGRGVTARAPSNTQTVDNDAAHTDADADDADDADNAEDGEDADDVDDAEGDADVHTDADAVNTKLDSGNDDGTHADTNIDAGTLSVEEAGNKMEGSRDAGATPSSWRPYLVLVSLFLCSHHLLLFVLLLLFMQAYLALDGAGDDQGRRPEATTSTTITTPEPPPAPGPAVRVDDKQVLAWLVERLQDGGGGSSSSSGGEAVVEVLVEALRTAAGLQTRAEDIAPARTHVATPGQQKPLPLQRPVLPSTPPATPPRRLRARVIQVRLPPVPPSRLSSTQVL